MKIIRADVSGFCFGVERAYRLTKRARGRQVAVVGELIHNPGVIAELTSRGVRQVSVPEEITGGTAIVRAHGTSNLQKARIAQHAAKVIDASCPFVIRLHTAAAQFVQQGLPVVIVGRRDHPEMVGVVEDFPAVIVTTNPRDRVLKQLAGREVGVLVQTTETVERLADIVAVLKKIKATPKIVNTICNATTDRQKAAITLAEQVDLVIVIGGRNSNNTKNLWQLTKKITKSHWIESAEELQQKWFRNIATVGVTAGASTPETMIKEVIQKLKKM